MRNVATATVIVLGSTIVSSEIVKQTADLVASLGIQEGGVLAGRAALANVFVMRGWSRPYERGAGAGVFPLDTGDVDFVCDVGWSWVDREWIVQRKVLEANQQGMKLDLEEERKRNMGKEGT